MKFNPKEKNPIYPNALRFCDVYSGIQFLTVDIRGEFLKRGVFLGEPYEYITPNQTKTFLAETNIDKPNILNDGKIFLADQGIVRYDCGTGKWTRSRFCISDTHEGMHEYNTWLENGGSEKLERIRHSLNMIDRSIVISKIEKEELFLKSIFK